MICTSHQTFLDHQIQWDGFGRANDTYGGRLEMHTEFWWGNLKETDHVAKLGTDLRRILKRILEKQDRRAWTDFIWLRIGARGRQL
jgi:hypothetical protein